MSYEYNPQDWYWAVGDTNAGTHVYSSASASYVVLADATYVAWLAAGNTATVIATAKALRSVLNDAYLAGAKTVTGTTSFLLAADDRAPRSLSSEQTVTKNKIKNAEGQATQGGTLTDNGNAAVASWYVLTQSGSATQSNGLTGGASPRYAFWIGPASGSTRVGICQAVEPYVAGNMDNQPLVLSFLAYASAGMNLRYAVVSNTTLSGNVDIVNDWTSSTYTNGNFFGSHVVEAVGVTTLTTTAQRITLNIDASTWAGGLNFRYYVLFWSESAMTAPDLFYLSQVSFELGSTPSTYSSRFLMEDNLIGSNSGTGGATFRSTIGLGTADTPILTGLDLGGSTDATITRSGAGAIQVEGVQVILSGAALGTPSSGTLTNCTALPIAGLTASTSTAIGVGTVELGHASDTTLTRVSAGVMAVEGATVLTTASGIVLLTSGTLSAVATLSLALTAYTGFRGLKLFVYSLIPVTDGADLWIRLSTDGGSTYDTSGYNYALNTQTDAAASIATTNSGSAAQLVFALVVGNGVTEGYDGEITITGQTSTALWSRLRHQGYCINSAATPAGTSSWGGGAREAAQDTDGIRIMFSTGNIASGGYALYGLP